MLPLHMQHHYHTTSTLHSADPRTIDLDPRNELLHNGESFSEVYSSLLSLGPPALLTLPPHTPRSPALKSSITSLHVHPVLETLLHLLNQDLGSAESVLRSGEMGERYAAEVAFFEAVAARMTGDFGAAREGYKKSSEGGGEMLRVGWRTLDAAMEFVRDVERVEGEGGKREGQQKQEVEEEDEAVVREELAWRQLDEIKAVVMFAGKRYGTARRMVHGEGR